MSNDFLPVHLIQTFVAFIESANITEAAERLGISQPAASVHLKKLEEMLPHPVFTMQGKRKVPNEYGKALYHTLSPALKNLNQQLKLVNAEFAEDTREYVIGYESAEMLSSFQSHAPGKKFKFEHLELVLAEKKIEEGDLDFYLSSQKAAPTSLINKRLEKKNWFVCAHPKWASQKKQMLNETWLLQTPMISLSHQQDAEKNTLEHYCSGRKKHPYSVAVDNSLLQREMVHEGLGYGIILMNENQRADTSLSVCSLPETLLPAKISYFVYKDRQKYESVMKNFGL